MGGTRRFGGGCLSPSLRLVIELVTVCHQLTVGVAPGWWQRVGAYASAKTADLFRYAAQEIAVFSPTVSVL